MSAPAETEIDKVIARIQKLFARSGRDGSTRGATEAEAETATKIAQELMLKYNLDIATIEARGRSADDASQVRVKDSLAGKTRHKWQRDLAKYVAEANFCYHLIKVRRDWDDDLRGGRGGFRETKEHVFVGRKANVITAKLMYEYLTGAVEDSAPEEDSRVEAGATYHADHGGNWYRLRSLADGKFERLDPKGEGLVYDSLSAAARAITGVSTNGYLFWGLGAASTAVSFKEGMADRLCERLAKRRQDLVAEHDARVRAEEEARAAERAAQREESKRRAERALGAAEPSVADAADRLRATARVAPAGATGLGVERPEADDGGEWAPGAGAEPAAAPAPETGTALVLASVYDESEREANEEMALGWPPGTFARWRREAEEREAARAKEREARLAEAEAAGEDGWKPGETVKEETPRQKAARERREAAEYAKRRAKWARESEAAARRAEREYAKKDHRAYRAGAAAGDKVGLDPQVAAASKQRRLGRECRDHWHCDPATAAHRCDAPDRARPCPSCGEARR